MPRYIDIEKRMEQWGHLCDSYFPNLPCQRFEDFISEAPTADVVPKSEVEKIFEEIDNWFEIYSEREYSFAEEETSKGHLPEAEAHDYALDIIKDLRQLCVAELKKKYTEGS